METLENCSSKAYACRRVSSHRHIVDRADSEKRLTGNDFWTLKVLIRVDVAWREGKVEPYGEKD